MAESELYSIIQFIEACDKEFENGMISYEMYKKCKIYKYKLSLLPAESKSALHKAVHDKLCFITSQYNANKSNVTNINDNIIIHAGSLNLIDNYSLSDFIIYLVKEKRLTDPKLIARFVYLELSKHLYYDISYSQINDKDRKRIIVDTPINVKKAKIFSYVVCTQWLQLYTYILSQFGIKVNKMNYDGEDHVWGEINLGNGEIIVADATEYIGSSIDLSNAKTNSPTRGFVILPERYSNIKLEPVFSEKSNFELRQAIEPYYKQNEELDMSLGYIDEKGYPVNIILNENDLFQYTNYRFTDEKDKIAFLKRARKFLLELDIPSNIDGYEIFAYYHMFIEKLPPEIRGNIGMKTIYTDTFNYKQERIKRKLLKAPEAYLEYLQGLIYDRYIQYLNDDEFNKIFSRVQTGNLDTDTLGEIALEREMLIAQINRRLNPYFAINQLSIYEPFGDDPKDTFQLYEPSSGKKVFNSFEEVKEYKLKNKID